MQVIPDIIHKINSTAEKKVFDLLKNTDCGNEWKAYHSLNVSEHQYKRWSELDFVLLGPDGLYALEVKGGRVACQDGIWFFTDRFGVSHKKSEGPFKQAETGMYALRDKLKENFPEEDITSLIMGWGVVFPDISFMARSPEMPSELICDRKYFKNCESLKKYIDGLLKYWKKKGENRFLKNTGSSLRKGIASYLRPNFDHVPSLKNRIDNLYQQVVSLTDEQYGYIDAIEETDRIMCTGGAGTGKSFLAVEAARRELASGRSVLLVARGNIFPEFLRAQITDRNLIVTSVEDLGNKLNSGSIEKSDVLIVDEGQDLMTIEFLDLFEQVLKGGLDQGRWRWFMDPNNQSGIYDCYDKDAEEILKSTGSVSLKLKRNCRNTEQIISETELATGADIGVTEIKGKGPPVHYAKAEYGIETADKLSQMLGIWLDSETVQGDIAIISPVAFEESSAAMLPKRFYRLIEVLSDSNVVTIPSNRITFSTVKDFKGLEKKFVALIDMSQKGGERDDVSDLYVAMTRSHAGLWIAVSSQFEKRLRELQEINVAKIIGNERESSGDN